MRFMTPKEIKLETIFGTVMNGLEKLNDGKGFSGSQWNPERFVFYIRNNP